MKKNTKILVKITPKKLLIFALFILATFVIIEVAFNRIVVNISNSHPGTIFWKSDIKPVNNDYVYFDFKHEFLPKGFEILSKKLVCIEGDKLQIDNQFIICNKQKYPIKRNTKTGSGKPIEQFYYKGIVPNRKAVVWGLNLESFDSRYWGFIDYKELKTIKLIW